MKTTNLEQAKMLQEILNLPTKKGSKEVQLKVNKMKNQNVNHNAKLVIGNKVRSFDHQGHDDYYAEGIITAVDVTGLVHMNTTLVRQGDEFYTIQNGKLGWDAHTQFPVKCYFGEYESRIKVLTC